MNIKKIVLSIFLMIVSNLVFADNAWPIYTIGNGQTFTDVLEASKALIGMGEYKSLLSFIAVLGVVIMAIMAGLNPAAYARQFLLFVVSALVLNTVVFTNKISVVVSDPITNTYNAVTNVPMAIGLPLSVSTTVGNKVTELIEKNFSTPDSMKITSAGYNMASQMMADMSKIKINDPYLRESMAKYSEDCFLNAVGSYEINMNSFTTNPDVWQAMKTNNDNLTTVYSEKTNPQGSVESCPSAWSKIDAQLAQFGVSQLERMARSMSGTPAFNALAAGYDSSTTWMTNSGSSIGAAGTIKQTAVINSMKPSFLAIAAKSNNQALSTALSASQAIQSQQSSWLTTAAIFSKTVGYLFSILQVFIVGLLPIVLVAFLIPGFGKKVMANFLQILIWLILWEPMLAIVNFITSTYAQTELTGIKMMTGGSDFGFNIANLAVVSESTAKLQAASSFMASMVPIISWSLVKGSIAFTEFLTAAMGGQFSQQAAASAATGSISLNNVSGNSASMNKADYSSMATVGMGPTMAQVGSGTLANMNAGGRVLTMNGSQVTSTYKINNSKSHTQNETSQQGVSKESSLTNTSSTGESGNKQHGVIQSGGTTTQSGSAKAVETSGNERRTTDSKVDKKESGSTSNEGQASSSSVTNMGAEIGVAPGDNSPPESGKGNQKPGFLKTMAGAAGVRAGGAIKSSNQTRGSGSVSNENVAGKEKGAGTQHVHDTKGGTGNTYRKDNTTGKKGSLDRTHGETGAIGNDASRGTKLKEDETNSIKIDNSSSQTSGLTYSNAVDVDQAWAAYDYAQNNAQPEIKGFGLKSGAELGAGLEDRMKGIEDEAGKRIKENKNLSMAEYKKYSGVPTDKTGADAVLADARAKTDYGQYGVRNPDGSYSKRDAIAGTTAFLNNARQNMEQIKNTTNDLLSLISAQSRVVDEKNFGPNQKSLFDNPVSLTKDNSTGQLWAGGAYALGAAASAYGVVSNVRDSYAAYKAVKAAQSAGGLASDLGVMFKTGGAAAGKAFLVADAISTVYSAATEGDKTLDNFRGADFLSPGSYGRLMGHGINELDKLASGALSGDKEKMQSLAGLIAHAVGREDAADIKGFTQWLLMAADDKINGK